ncbi:TRAP transporter substrate-binding protein [Thermodesulfobacteriota bacterium]
MKKILFGLLLFLVIAAAPASSRSAGPMKPIELKLATHMPSMHSHIKQILVPWAQEVEKRTNGKVKITLFTSSSLGRVNEMYDVVKEGTADISLVVPAQVRGRFPMQEIFFIPNLIPGGIANPTGVKIRDMLFKKYLSPIEFKDVRVLWTARFEPYALQMVKKPVRTITEVRGLSIGMVGGKIAAAMLKAIGASPEVVVMPEMYTALERGMVDGVIMAKQPLLAFKFMEVVKYVTDIDSLLGSSANFIAMNKKTWSKLPKDVQKVFNELVPWVINLQGEVYARLDKKIMNVSKAKGVEFIELSQADLKKISKDIKFIENNWVADMKKKKLPGEEMLADVYKILGNK